jgi:hypothetical protein
VLYIFSNIQCSHDMSSFLHSSSHHLHSKDLVSGCVKDIDRDTDGRIDRYEIVDFAINLTVQVQDLQKKNQSFKNLVKNYKRGLAFALFVVVLLCASLFAISIAVAEMTKDVAVSGKGLMTRAGTDNLVKTGVSGLELVALAPANDQPVHQDGSKFLGCLFQDQADLLSTDSFFTGTVIDSPDGSKHVIQVHDYESNSDGGAVIVDTSGQKYLIKTNDKSCSTVMTRDGRRLQSPDDGVVSLQMNVTLEPEDVDEPVEDGWQIVNPEDINEVEDGWPLVNPEDIVEHVEPVYGWGVNPNPEFIVEPVEDTDAGLGEDGDVLP